MSRMFLVNIPLMFAAVWRVLQMFVDDRVKAKIRFLRKADFHILHEFVDRDSLPESLGGKAKEKLLSDKQGQLACMSFICAKLTLFGSSSSASRMSTGDQVHLHCLLAGLSACIIPCAHFNNSLGMHAILHIPAALMHVALCMYSTGNKLFYPTFATSTANEAFVPKSIWDHCLLQQTRCHVSRGAQPWLKLLCCPCRLPSPFLASSECRDSAPH